MARTAVCRCQDPTADGYSDRCARATGSSWDPTRGVQSTDADRHRYARKGYGPR